MYRHSRDVSFAVCHTLVPYPLTRRRSKVFRKDQTRHHTFVLRAVVEWPADGGELPFWRGTIRHLPGDTVRSVKNIEEVTEFIAGYLGEDLDMQVEGE